MIRIKKTGQPPNVDFALSISVLRFNCHGSALVYRIINCKVCGSMLSRVMAAAWLLP